MNDKNIKFSKIEIRKAMLKKRRLMTESLVLEKSRQIVECIFKHPLYKYANQICLYMPIQNEIDVTLMFDKVFSDGKALFLPKVFGDRMDFYYYDKEVDLVKGTYDIWEPDSKIVLVPDDNTLVICPGSVFSKTGDRIGYGGGYYDKYLSKYPMVKTMAVAYEFQVHDEIPCEPTDHKMDYCVSEENIYEKGE